jgi:serine protease 16
MLTDVHPSYTESADSMLYLEHRYYGESFPSETAVDYRYLSSRQAVRDIATFVQLVEVQQLINRITRDNHDASWERSTAAAETKTWVTFGGSYPGMLAAWSRLLHPESIFAAVSNSAPIQAQLEFPEYYERVGYDLENEDVGGSAVCRYIVEEGHAQVVAILEGRGRGEGGGGGGNEDVDSESDELDHVAMLFNVCGGSELLRVSRRNMEVSIIHWCKGTYAFRTQVVASYIILLLINNLDHLSVVCR